MKRRLALVLAFSLPVALAAAQDGRTLRAPSPSPAASPASQSDEPAGRAELSPDGLKAIDVGLAYLKARQQDSGRWTATNPRWSMSVTALAGLALLAHGEVPGRGEYGKTLESAIEFVLRSQVPETDPLMGGTFFDYYPDKPDDNDRIMHGHGFALLFLGEAYGQASSPDLRQRIHKALVRGVKLTERTQTEAGGWFYLPGDLRDEGSVTITQIQGLRAARNAGIVVSKSTIDRAVDYIRKSQIPTGGLKGGVRYTSTHGQATPALTAAGIAVYYGAGEYNSPGIESGFEYLSKNMLMDDFQHFWFYTHFYAVQAYHQRGGPDWAGYFARLQREILGGLDTKYGLWHDPAGGDVFGTACAVLCLEVPLRYLPIFQR